jgi:phage RecT family recombinase
MVTNATTTATAEDREKAASLAVIQADAKIQIREYLLSNASIERFATMMGAREARYYISSVLMAVAYSPKLMECTKESILKCALRAAALQMSCDEGLHQGQLVPYKGEAKLIIHYLGLINLGQRTGKFKTFNWGAIQEGMTVTSDRLTGMHVITGEPINEDSPALGYFAYFEQMNGYCKSEYMTIHQIHEHAKKWAPSYTYPNSAWNDPKKLPAMEQKTVIRKLMKQADMSGKEGAKLAAALNENDFVEDADLVIPGEEHKDLETVVVGKETRATPKNVVELSRPLAPIDLRSWLSAKVNAIGIYQHTPEQIGLMDGMMDMIFAPDKDASKLRRSCIHFLWGYDSSKKLSGPQVKATLDWLAPIKDSGGAYSPDPMASRELHGVWEAEQLTKGQVPLPGLKNPA